MAGMRPGGYSDEELSEDDQFADDEDFAGCSTWPKESSASRDVVETSSLQLNGNVTKLQYTSQQELMLDSKRTRPQTSRIAPCNLLAGLGNNGTDSAPTAWSSTSDDVVNLDDFRLAVMKNSVEAVERYLAHGVDVNTRFRSGWTALMYAAHSVAPECIDCLIRHDANANAHKDMYSALMAACGSTTDNESLILTCVNKLIDAGADINASDRHNMSPLMYAAREGRATVVQRLLTLTADINQQDNKGYTALMWAASAGHMKVVSILVTADADTTKQKADGKTAADIAAAKGHQQVLQLLKPGCEAMAALGGGGGDASAVTSTELASSETLSKTRSPGSSLSAGNPGLSGPPSHPVAQPDGCATNPVRLLDQSSQSTSSSGGSGGTVVTYGELEVFLSGLDLTRLIPLFQEQQISFATFLRLTDVDLLKMGIKELGVRKRILDAIRETHKKNWETSSLASVQYNRKICCSEAVVMLANIKQHAAYIGSTIGYIDDQISADHKIVLDAPPENEAGVKDLCINAEEAMVNVKNLYEELSTLRRHLEKICHNHDFRPPELITRQKRLSRHSRKRWYRLAALGTFVVGCTVAFIAVGKR